MVSCTSQIPVGAKLALVALAKGTSPLVVRDVTDIAHPITRCMISGASFHRFVDATHVSYIVTNPDGHGALYVTDLRDSSDTLIRSWTNEARSTGSTPGALTGRTSPTSAPTVTRWHGTCSAAATT
jgi:hypothetical protein